MTIKSLKVALMALATIFVASCSSSDDSEPVAVTGITIDKESIEVSVESTELLKATLQPAGAKGDITWSTSDASIASVNKGVVTGLKIGEATIVASYGAYSAKTVVEVLPKKLDPSQLPATLKGDDYYLFHIDETSYEYIKDKVAHDFRPDELNKFLYIWDNTYAAGTSNGLNFYEQPQGWISLVVGNVGWSGAGLMITEGFGQIDMTAMYENPEDYVFHVAVKSAQAQSSICFVLNDGRAEGKLVIGNLPIEDIQPIADYARDNEWHSIEIPVTKLNELGLFYKDPFTGVNVMSILAGGISGTTVDYDACFFYKKAK